MTNKTKYDIIIENAAKELSINNINKLKWEIPQYSKSQINKAGKIISNSAAATKEHEEAMSILNNWRASHAYPLQVICSNLRRTNSNAIVVQRLKRLDSIVGKIRRFPEMQLYKMQDLGGCRVIVNTVEQVYQAIDKYKRSKIRHILKREYDYIQEPKQSGYRSYHMVYQFHSDKKETYNQNMLIEIQFRTKLQHIWATAVEMMSIYTKSNLKSSQGNKDILQFFTLVSSVFAIKENMPTCPNTSNNIDILKSQIKALDDKHKIISTLSGINIATNYTEQQNLSKNYYYLLILDYKKQTLTVRQFAKSKIVLATKAYDIIEKNLNVNVVLVSATSFTALKAAYPNYFVDISHFINEIQSIIK